MLTPRIVRGQEFIEHLDPRRAEDFHSQSVHVLILDAQNRVGTEDRRCLEIAHDGIVNGFWLDQRIVEPEAIDDAVMRSEEHTSELQSRLHLVCRLLLEKKKEY